MSYLLDTNIIVRLAESSSDLRESVLNTLRVLRSSSSEICYTPQIVAEFWNVCTRPTTSRGGLGLTVEQTERKVGLIEKHFRLLPDNLATYSEWRQLVKTHSILGVQVHDAKLVASMIVHGIDELITFNGSDFKRFGFIKILDPRDL